MIGSVRGIVIDRQPARTGPGAEVTVEVGGVGYRLIVGAGRVGVLGLGVEVFLWVHTHVREDALVLYGFADRDERACFEALIGAPGVGPGLALSALTVHRPDGLRRAVATDDLAALCLIPGVGKKTAAKLAIELKSRLGADMGDLGPMTLAQGGHSSVDPSGGRSTLGEVRAALETLGYTPSEVVEATSDLDLTLPVETLVRHALRTAAR